MRQIRQVHEDQTFARATEWAEPSPPQPPAAANPFAVVTGPGAAALFGTSEHTSGVRVLSGTFTPVGQPPTFEAYGVGGGPASGFDLGITQPAALTVVAVWTFVGSGTVVGTHSGGYGFVMGGDAWARPHVRASASTFPGAQVMVNPAGQIVCQISRVSSAGAVVSLGQGGALSHSEPKLPVDAPNGEEVTVLYHTNGENSEPVGRLLAVALYARVLSDAECDSLYASLRSYYAAKSITVA